ncbi:MAG: hypothetical protein LBU73_06785 [Helicobacteraceae bacterium]|jgi:Fe-S cluster biosynthesis and repair protein YggX|nr:hypothetical protein [Helicobacteraceae bacterium]
MDNLPGMPPEVSAALDIWLSNARVDNDFTPTSDRETARLLGEKQIAQVSKTTIQRWREKYKWAEHLSGIVTLAMADAEKRKVVEKHTQRQLIEKSADDLTKIREIANSCYESMEHYAKDTADLMRENPKAVSNERMRLTLEIFKTASDREMKTLDRNAAMDLADRITGEQALAKLAAEIIDIEAEAENVG